MKTGEPSITINGFKLDGAQSMTVRVAIESFAVMLQEDGLGDDDHGKKMVRLYLDRIEEIRLLTYR